MKMVKCWWCGEDTPIEPERNKRVTRKEEGEEAGQQRRKSRVSQRRLVGRRLLAKTPLFSKRGMQRAG